MTKQIQPPSVEPASIHRSEPVEVRLSDYFDPLSLEWDESDYKAAEASRNFSEELHGNH